MAMIWSLGFICTADAAPMELGLKPVVLGNEYSISLFMDDKVLRNPNAALTGFLEIKPGMSFPWHRFWICGIRIRRQSCRIFRQ